MITAILYARVSSKEQEEEGYSIPAQLKLLKEYAFKNGLKIVKEFIDIETAKQAGRENFNLMIEFLKQKPDVKTILCEKTDRLSRNFRDIATLDDLINSQNINIILVKENTIISQTSKSHEKFIFGIKALMAKNYIDNLSEEVKKGMLQKAEQGEYPTVAPLGYINNLQTKHIEIDKLRAPIIQKLFRLYATGDYSLTQITKIAYDEGLRNKSGNRVARSGIEWILKNPVYYGYFNFNGKLYKGIHEPLISKELFDIVQENLHNRNKPKQRKHNFAFVGLLTCAKCGCGITAEKHKGKYVYYRCTGAKGKCGNSYVKEEILEGQFAEIVQSIQIDEKLIEWVKEALHNSHKDEKEYHEQQVKTLQNQYDKLQKRLEQMYIDKLDGKITEEFYEEKTDEWQREQKYTLASIEDHQNANRNYFEQGIHILELSKKAYSLYVKQKVSEKRKLLNFILLNCTLENGNLIPQYRKPFDLLAKQPLFANRRP